MEFLSKNEEETSKIALNFGKEIKSKPDKAVVVGLYGDLGSGKTTFMKYLAEYFGIKETIQSPTFVIMKIYKTSPPAPLLGKERGEENESFIGGEVFEHLVHIDAYRIEKWEEMINLGWREITSDPQNLVCIEWPERIAEIMPEHTKIFFEHGNEENERKIKIEL